MNQSCSLHEAKGEEACLGLMRVGLPAFISGLAVIYTHYYVECYLYGFVVRITYKTKNYLTVLLSLQYYCRGCTDNLCMDCSLISA